MRPARRGIQPVCYNEDAIEVANGKVVRKRKKNNDVEATVERPRPEAVLVSLPSKKPRSMKNEDDSAFLQAVGSLPFDPDRPTDGKANSWHAFLSRKVEQDTDVPKEGNNVPKEGDEVPKEGDDVPKEGIDVPKGGIDDVTKDHPFPSTSDDLGSGDAKAKVGNDSKLTDETTESIVTATGEEETEAFLAEQEVARESIAHSDALMSEITGNEETQVDK